MIAEVASAIGVGLALGVITGLPLGVVNVGVVATAVRYGARAGAAIGIGGALGDAIHATIAFAGLGPVIAARPTLSAVLTLASGVLLLSFAWHVARERSPVSGDGDAIERRSTVRRIGAGLVLTLPNPAALAAWIAVSTALGDGRSHAAAAATAIGVGIGSAAYFVALAQVAARTSRALKRPRWFDRGAAIVLAVIGVAAIVRGVWRLA